MTQRDEVYVLHETLFHEFFSGFNESHPDLVNLVVDKYCMLYERRGDEVREFIFNKILRDELVKLPEEEQLEHVKWLMLTGKTEIGDKYFETTGIPHLHPKAFVHNR